MLDTHGDIDTFGGLPVADWPSAGEDGPQGAGGGTGTLPEVDAVAWRIAVHSYESKESWPEAFARFAGTVDLGRVRALIVGAWSDAYDKGPEEVVEALLAAKDRLTALRALFIGDMTSEECEISWIVQGDLTPLLAAFPKLEVFGVRGGNHLEFPPVRHERLRDLTVESGGLPAAAVRGIAASDFPSLTSLELWLGESEYGGDASVADLAPILAGTRLPALRSLGLCDSEIQDEVAAAVASAAIVPQLEELDLSMGVLTDTGAEALLAGQSLGHLHLLDLEHNYLSEAVCDRLREALEPSGVELELDPGDAESDEEEDGTVWRFVAVGE